jgi:protein-S-isoprenylcysteine O-methyltransferase Ste14
MTLKSSDQATENQSTPPKKNNYDKPLWIILFGISSSIVASGCIAIIQLAAPDILTIFVKYTSTLPVLFIYISWTFFITMYVILSAYEKRWPSLNTEKYQIKEIIKSAHYIALYVWGFALFAFYYALAFFSNNNTLSSGKQWMVYTISSFTHPIVVQTVGFCALIVGILYVIYGRITINGHWSKQIVIYDPPYLIQNGIYKSSRHPIYSGQMAMTAGTTLLLDQVWCLFLLLVVLAAIYIRLSREERLLTRKYGEIYNNYKDTSKILF